MAYPLSTYYYSYLTDKETEMQQWSKVEPEIWKWHLRLALSAKGPQFAASLDLFCAIIPQ